MRATFVILFAFLLLGCYEPPKYEYSELGTAKVSGHQKPHASFGRLLCNFRVQINDLNLGYSGSSKNEKEHNKCLTMKNGDQITVIRGTRVGEDTSFPAVIYFGQINDIKFPLN